MQAETLSGATDRGSCQKLKPPITLASMSDPCVGAYHGQQTTLQMRHGHKQQRALASRRRGLGDQKSSPVPMTDMRGPVRQGVVQHCARQLPGAVGPEPLLGSLRSLPLSLMGSLGVAGGKPGELLVGSWGPSRHRLCLFGNRGESQDLLVSVIMQQLKCSTGNRAAEADTEQAPSIMQYLQLPVDVKATASAYSCMQEGNIASA